MAASAKTRPGFGNNSKAVSVTWLLVRGRETPGSHVTGPCTAHRSAKSLSRPCNNPLGRTPRRAAWRSAWPGAVVTAGATLCVPLPFPATSGSPPQSSALDYAWWPPAFSSHPGWTSCCQESTGLSVPVSDAPPGARAAAAPGPGCPIPTHPRSLCSAPPPGLTGQEEGCCDARNWQCPRGKGGSSADGADHVLTTGSKPQRQRPPSPAQPRPAAPGSASASPRSGSSGPASPSAASPGTAWASPAAAPHSEPSAVGTGGQSGEPRRVGGCGEDETARLPGRGSPPRPPPPTLGSGRRLGGPLGRYPQELISLLLLEGQAVEVA